MLSFILKDIINCEKENMTFPEQTVRLVSNLLLFRYERTISGNKRRHTERRQPDQYMTRLPSFCISSI